MSKLFELVSIEEKPEVFGSYYCIDDNNEMYQWFFDMDGWSIKDDEPKPKSWFKPVPNIMSGGHSFIGFLNAEGESRPSSIFDKKGIMASNVEILLKSQVLDEGCFFGVSGFKVDKLPTKLNRMEEILKLIDAYWKFDNFQQPMSSWHEKQALLEAVKKAGKNFVQPDVSRSFRLTPSEQEAFKKSGSKTIRFELGGIGIGVSYKKENGKWKDITDYGSW